MRILFKTDNINRTSIFYHIQFVFYIYKYICIHIYVYKYIYIYIYIEDFNIYIYIYIYTRGFICDDNGIVGIYTYLWLVIRTIFIFHHIVNFIIPTDELTFYKGVAQAPTRTGRSLRLEMPSFC